MQNYQYLLKKILAENTYKVDGQMNIDLRETRSGNCASIFGHFMEWDLRKGFPAVTTKKLAFNAVMGELLWFLSGKTDIPSLREFTGLEDDSWTIWSQDAERSSKFSPKRFNGNNLGDMYGVQWRTKRVPVNGWVSFKPKQDSDSSYTPVGNPTVYGVGINDVPGLSKDNPKIYKIWSDMLCRCYGSRKQHQATRDQGVTVSPRWHMLSNFYQDVFTLSGFQDWVSDTSSYDFDKDYFGGKVYSRNTCIFLEKPVNQMLNGGGQGLRIFKVGDKVLFGLSQLAEHFDTYRQHNLLKRLSERGEKFEELTDTLDVVYRPRIFIDQLENLVTSIKNNPESRYHIVDAWNPEYKTKSALGACHQMFQCFVTDDGELDLMWHQRSVDTFLGLPFNIASYAALAHIIARLTNTRVRYLKCSLGDTHIYEQHLDPIFEQLEREPYNSPRLVMPDELMLSKLSDIDHLTASDFRLRDYAHHGVLKGKLTVGGEE